MSAFDSLKKFIGIEEIDDENVTAEEVQAAKEQIAKEGPRDVSYGSTIRKPAEFTKPSDAAKAVPVERRISVANTNAFKLVLIEPKSFDECPKLVDGLKGRRPIIINLEKIVTETAKKIFDFLSGATYAISSFSHRKVWIFLQIRKTGAASTSERIRALGDKLRGI